MKKNLPFFLFIVSLSIFSQVPSYYNDVNLNQTNTALKNALATKIISTHITNLSYTPGVWNTLKQTDLDPNDNTKVLLIYGYSDSDGNYITDRTRNKELNGGSSGTQWNREHTYAKSLGTPNLGTSGPGADAHHLRAADITFNGQRSSKKFAAGSGNAGDVAGGWYPGDEWKGDVARMMMYTYLRYGNQCLPTGVGVGSTAASDSNMLDLFLAWNVEDPVSDFEKQRNPILEGIQGNRNPFIDNPAFATQIWGGPQAEDLFGNGGSSSDTQAPTAPTNLITSNVSQTSVNLTWAASTDNTGVTAYDVYNGTTKTATVTTTTYHVTNLTATTAYTFSVKAKDAAGNVSSASNVASITTLSGNNNGGNGLATELLISEYAEGSSNNKALEIANFTGATINLSSYSLKKASNGGGWSNTLTLSGQLENGKVYVIANSNASTTVKNKAQRIDTSVLSFNGNDAIGLFKNNSLIDIIGNPTSSSTFAQDKTLQRKSAIKSPNSSYVTSEWNILAKDTFNGLGNHTIDGESVADTTAPTTPTNLATSNVTQTSVNLNWTASTDNTGVTAYNVYKGATKITTVTTTNYTVTGLTAATNYTFSIKAKDKAGNVSATSNVIGVTTKAIVVNYCATKGNNTNFEYIDNVVLGGIANTTAANAGYRDFTSQTGNITVGNNTIIVSAGFSSSSYTEFWKVWIDFNKNGTFESSEEVVSGSSSSAGNLSYSFSVPSSALAGKTRMRVSMKWNAPPTACETFSYGEVEDYSVNITSSRGNNNSNTIIADGKLGNETPIFSANIFPNPTAGFIKIQMADDREANFKVINLIGQKVLHGKVNHSNINVSNLQTEMYILEVNDGQRSFTKKFIKK